MRMLLALLAKRYNGGKVLDKAQCYVGDGWYAPDNGLKELQDEIRSRLDEGYTTMKIKVGGASIPDDVRRVDSRRLEVRLLTPLDLAVSKPSRFSAQDSVIQMQFFAHRSRQ